MSASDPLARYVRQMQFAPLGRAGQENIARSRVFLCGCGALGTVLANTLVRAGVGFVRIVDRDFIEPNNLQRQVLFDEEDIAAALPKSIAAANKLRKINSQVEIEAEVADVDPMNIESFAGDVDLILDGTDNFETRFLINDLSQKLKLPWVYGGCLGAEGQSLTIIPGETPCLRCLIAEPPPPGESPTCDTAGILGPIINVVASIQACEALKILSGHPETINRQWTIINLWDNSIRQIDVSGLRGSGNCPACEQGVYPWLEGERTSQSAVLCGRNAVQVSPAAGTAEKLDLAALERKLAPLGETSRNAFLLRAAIDPYLLTVFADGRAIITGTDEINTAKTVYARYVGA